MTPQDGKPQTAAAIQARRAAIAAMIQRVDQALQQMRRERATISVAAVSRRAGVSRTFLYQNTKARALVTSASSEHAKNAAVQATAAAHAETAPWRERALNAENELKRAHGEITAQRGRIGELLGRIRDLEHDLPEDGIQRTITENHALRAQVRQLTQDNRRLEERLAGARDNNRFLDKRIADLEAELTDPSRQRGVHLMPAVPLDASDAVELVDLPHPCPQTVLAHDPQLDECQREGQACKGYADRSHDVGPAGTAGHNDRHGAEA